ncbi:hypothetical protein N8940_01325 [Sphingomonadaceae bacterium]|nr:hypothetical protein [Sphingomonadaceae bacterium]
MLEDKALRDAAKALVAADIAHLKSDLRAKSVGERVIGRAAEGASDVFEEAVEVADSNRGVFAALIAAALIWFARNPLMDLFSDDSDGDLDGNDSEEFDAERTAEDSYD